MCLRVCHLQGAVSAATGKVPCAGVPGNACWCSAGPQVHLLTAWKQAPAGVVSVIKSQRQPPLTLLTKCCLAHELVVRLLFYFGVKAHQNVCSCSNKTYLRKA